MKLSLLVFVALFSQFGHAVSFEKSFKESIVCQMVSQMNGYDKSGNRIHSDAKEVLLTTQIHRVYYVAGNTIYRQSSAISIEPVQELQGGFRSESTTIAKKETTVDGEKLIEKDSGHTRTVRIPTNTVSDYDFNTESIFLVKGDVKYLVSRKNNGKSEETFGSKTVTKKIDDKVRIEVTTENTPYIRYDEDGSYYEILKYELTCKYQTVE